MKRAVVMATPPTEEYQPFADQAREAIAHQVAAIERQQEQARRRLLKQGENDASYLPPSE
jgi:hypothetical protein